MDDHGQSQVMFFRMCVSHRMNLLCDNALLSDKPDEQVHAPNVDAPTEITVEVLKVDRSSAITAENIEIKEKGLYYLGRNQGIARDVTATQNWKSRIVRFRI